MDELKLEVFWNDIPVGKKNAVSYQYLIGLWGRPEREVRKILHRLSAYDNYDDYILIRSGKGKGFYRTDDHIEIKAYKRECLKKGKSVFAPVKKINRVLRNNTDQYELENNMRLVRERCGKSQSEVCEIMKIYDKAFDIPMLSKMENGVCLPTPYQLSFLADIYGCEANEIIRYDFSVSN